jgi:CRISPR-associated endonuclease/helicase Cas3
MTKYIAHGPDHLLTDHLESVAALTASFSVSTAKPWGHLAGLWHDLGKFRPGFQNYVREDPDAHIEGRTAVTSDRTHSAAGALHALQSFEKSYGANGRRAGWLLAHLIAAHHAGLYDGSDLADRLYGARCVEAERERCEAVDACERACPELLSLPDGLDPRTAIISIPGIQEREEPLAQALWLRMLFSALVDADFLDTEAYFDSRRASERRGFPPLADYLSRLDDYLDGLGELVRSSGRHDDPVMQARARVLAECRAAAEAPPGVFSLEVPTGGGKTLASLAFALRHAVRHHLDRVIVAIPYTSIVEQTVDVFAGIFGRDAVVEHHSQADADVTQETARSRLACENWDAPLVVTTNVQLFESLFAARSSRCRKVHRIQRSVIVLDEAQTLPPPFLQPTLDALRLLARHYGTSVVSCTATQPVLTDMQRFDPRRSLRGLTRANHRPHEIVRDPDTLYAGLERVRIRWPDDLHRVDEIEDVAARLAAEDSVLAVVGTRRDAADLTRALDAATGSRTTLHLSAAMCGQHRADVIARIRQHLDARCAGDRAPLRVVSTQLVEAGVDVDFPVVYRALAGLDSIAQAAGRCNREGRLGPGCGRVEVIVRPVPRSLASLVRAQQATVSVLGDERPSTLSPALFRRYFEHWYSQFDLDEKGILDLLKKSPDFDLQLRTAAERYRLVDAKDQVSIVVPYAPSTSGTVARDQALAALDRGEANRWQFRILQRYIVQARRHDALAWLAQGDVREPMPGWFVLVDELRYDDRFGLLPSGSSYEPVSLVE